MDDQAKNPDIESILNDENAESNSSVEIQKDSIDYKDKYARLLAEYTNYAKQRDAEISSSIKFANKNLVLKIIDIIDDIEAGLVQEQVSEETKSILNILKIKVLQILAMEGVLEIELTSGDAFDSENCEVVQTMEDKDFAGKIVQVLRKGYTMSDRVIRTAKVIVGK